MFIILLDLALVTVIAVASFQAGRLVGLLEAMKQDKPNKKG